TPPPPHLIPILPSSYHAKPNLSVAQPLTAFSPQQNQAITTSIEEEGVQYFPYCSLSNLALVCDRGSKASPISNIFASNMLCDLHLNGSESYAFLLYRLKSIEVEKEETT
ncbi:hypothetical protein, partial [Helicobacter cetorum]|uniref:hypothetical protein n=1 Tax=Helicobacter cetorum TaxID=138563 RepID=UPI001F3F37BA